MVQVMKIDGLIASGEDGLVASGETNGTDLQMPIRNYNSVSGNHEATITSWNAVGKGGNISIPVNITLTSIDTPAPSTVGSIIGKYHYVGLKFPFVHTV